MSNGYVCSWSYDSDGSCHLRVPAPGPDHALHHLDSMDMFKLPDFKIPDIPSMGSDDKEKQPERDSYGFVVHNPEGGGIYLCSSGV